MEDLFYKYTQAHAATFHQNNEKHKTVKFRKLVRRKSPTLKDQNGLFSSEHSVESLTSLILTEPVKV